MIEPLTATPEIRNVESTNAELTNAPDLLGMTKAQMLSYAEENGIKGVNGRMNKAAILEVLSNA